MKRALLISLCLILAVLALLFVGFDQRLIVQQYHLQTDKLGGSLRIAVLSDYHGVEYGGNGSELASATAMLNPDMILLAGDMISSDGQPEQELALFSKLSTLAPVYYVTGNHEYWECDVPALLDSITQAGVTVLNADCVTAEIRGMRVNLCGVPDPSAGSDTHDDLVRAAAEREPEAYTILLAHRPELIEQYAATDWFNLTVSGHAHGGQVRIPFLLNGLYAPNQGWFPRYAGGRYDISGMTMIVSRGLFYNYIPRIFNRPELVLVTINE